MTPERLAYGQKIYHSLYDYAVACSFTSHQIYMLCLKWKMTPEKWFKKVRGHPRKKWKLTPSRLHVFQEERKITPWQDSPMHKSRFED